MRGDPIAAEILGICQNCLHRLAMWSLPPGATTQKWFLCGCWCSLGLEGVSEVSWDVWEGM